MNPIDKRIIKFIRKHHVLNLATSSDNMPYAASIFYIYIESENKLIFASDDKTRHIQDCIKQPIVAGTIALETIFISRIRGIQFKGKVSEINDEILRKNYIKRFPLALFIPFKLWVIELHYIKMTDNRLGFGKKIIWEKELHQIQ